MGSFIKPLVDPGNLFGGRGEDISITGIIDPLGEQVGAHTGKRAFNPLGTVTDFLGLTGQEEQTPLPPAGDTDLDLEAVVQEADTSAEEERKRLTALRKNKSGTILTSGKGLLSKAPGQKKTLLGL